MKFGPKLACLGFMFSFLLMNGISESLADEMPGKGAKTKFEVCRHYKTDYFLCAKYTYWPVDSGKVRAVFENICPNSRLTGMVYTSESGYGIDILHRNNPDYEESRRRGELGTGNKYVFEYPNISHGSTTDGSPGVVCYFQPQQKFIDGINAGRFIKRGVRWHSIERWQTEKENPSAEEGCPYVNPFYGQCEKYRSSR